jgi:hypothetical protein
MLHRILTSFSLFILLVLVHIPLKGQFALQVELGSSPQYHCAGELLSLSPQVEGGVAPYSYRWSTGDTTDELSLLLQAGDSLNIGLEVMDAQGTWVRETVQMIAFGNCIWPGDMNGDAIANHVDLLEWGRAFGAQGPQRPNAHTNWVGQPAPDWGHSLPGGHDYAYADTDGDGTVDTTDLQAIHKNYQRVPPSGNNSSAAGLPLQLAFPADSSLQAGDRVRIPLTLGTDSLLADSISGLAFSILFDPGMVVPGSIEIEYDSSWLGTPGRDLVGLHRDFHAEGQLDVALVRTVSGTRSGQGKLFDVVVTIDNIAGKNNAVNTLTIEMADVSLIQGNGRKLAVNSPALNLEVYSVGAERPAPPEEIPLQVYPNPTDGFLIIRPGDDEVEWLAVYDGQGRQLMVQEKSLTSISALDLRSWNGGYYFLQMRSKKQGTMWKKFQLIR